MGSVQFSLIDAHSGKDLGPASLEQVRAARESVNMRFIIDEAGRPIDSETPVSALPPGARIVDLQMLMGNEAKTVQKAAPVQSVVPARPAASDASAAELKALKASIARQAATQRAKYTGWKPLTIWYTFWALVFACGAAAALVAGAVPVFMAGAVVTALICLYIRYLYRGGTRRVWFVIF